MRRYPRARVTTIGFAVVVCLMQGGALAGPNATEAPTDAAVLPASSPVGDCGSVAASEATAPVVLAPAAVTPMLGVADTPQPTQTPLDAAAIAPAGLAVAEPARPGERGTREPSERTRAISFIILRGLQEAGPFLGGR